MNHETPRPGDDSNDSAYEFLQFLSDPTRSERMVEGAYEQDHERERALLAVHGALKGTTLDCDTCGEVCEHQAIRLRDAFMLRARELTDVMARGLALYEECRNFGVDEPGCVNKIYAAWSELAILFDYLEPQSHLPDTYEDEEEAAADEEDTDG